MVFTFSLSENSRKKLNIVDPCEWVKKNKTTDENQLYIHIQGKEKREREKERGEKNDGN